MWKKKPIRLLLVLLELVFPPCNLAVTLMKHVACHFYVEGFISDVHEIRR